MTWVKGQSGNPQGGTSSDRQAIMRIRKSIDLALDKMKHGQAVGIVAFQEKLAESFENQFLPTLKAVAPLLPKDLFIERSNGMDVNKLSDAELAEVVAKRARALRDQESTPNLKDTGTK